MMKTKSISIILTGLFLIACSHIEKKPKDDIMTKLIGTWILDSISLPGGGFEKLDTSLNSHNSPLTFKKDSSYRLINICLIHTGKYYILNNPSRELSTLVLLPDIELIDGDTLRTYMNFDIVKISANRLQILGETTLS